jgi:hypothetical protein
VPPSTYAMTASNTIKCRQQLEYLPVSRLSVVITDKYQVKHPPHSKYSQDIH